MHYALLPFFGIRAVMCCVLRCVNSIKAFRGRVHGDNFTTDTF